MYAEMTTIMAVLVEQSTECDASEHRSPEGAHAQEMPATDGELLTRFIRDRQQEAFTELVSRHASMVLGVCRRILGDEHEAEDVFQAKFLILANHADRIRRRRSSSVAAWLHRVAYRAALRAAQARRRKGKLLKNDVESLELEQWRKIARQEEQNLLHEELNRLPELYREAVVLCCLEGKTRAEAARQLASTPEAVQKRVARGQQILRSRLARRGVAVTAALAAAAPSAGEAAMLPSLVSLTREICTATVLHADKAVYSTNVGDIAEQGAASMNSLTPVLTPVVLICTPLLLLAGTTIGDSNDTARTGTLAVFAAADRQPAADSSYLVALADDNNAEGSNTGQDAANESAGLRKIVGRQKGDQLKVYLKGTQGVYVNGTQISDKTLAKLVPIMGLDEAVVTNALEVRPARVDGVVELLRKAGVKKIAATSPKLTLSELGEANRQHSARHLEERLRKILARQKGDQLQVYVDSRGTYINGTSLKAGDLPMIVRESGLDHAVITPAADVTAERLAKTEASLKDAGVKQVEVDEAP